MRVVFLEDVAGVANGGDVRDVKNGFARNYLIPQGLATPATHNALQRIESLKVHAETERVRTLEDMRALASVLDGVQVSIPVRAGANGRLYGSVTNVMVAEELANITEKEIDRRTVGIDDPIRQLGVFDIALGLHAEVDATVQLLVYPAGANPEEFLASLQEQESEAEDEIEDLDEDSDEEADEESVDEPEDEVSEPDEVDEAEPDETDETEEEE